MPVCRVVLSLSVVLAANVVAAAKPTDAAAANGDGSTSQRAMVFKTEDAADAEMQRLTKNSPKDVAIMISTERDYKRGLDVEAVEFATPDRKKRKVYLAYPTDFNDYLSKGWWGKPLDFEVRYRNNVERILERGFRSDVVLRTVHLPPFDPEWIVGVVRTENGYRAFRLDASYFIWRAQLDEKQKLPTIRGIYKDKPIPTATAMRLAVLWRRFLTDRKNYGTEKGSYGESSHFIFSVDGVTANAMAWDKGTKAHEIVQVSDDIYDFVIGKKSEGALVESIKKAEKKLTLKR
jgi:hypothetical protein